MSIEALGRLTPGEAESLKEAQAAADRMWEKRYMSFIAQGYDPEDSRALATLDVEMENLTHKDIMGAKVAEIQMLRDLPDNMQAAATPDDL